MKIKVDGKWQKNVSVKNCTGYRAERIKLDDSDLSELAKMRGRDLLATVRQLAGRVRPHTGGFFDESNPTKGFFERTPTSRRPDGPEMQYLGPTRSGRWSSACPARSQEPRGPIPNKVEVKFMESPMLNADFADIEKRVMAQLANKTGVAEAMMGRRAVERGRQSGKSAEAVLELFRKAYQPIWQAAMNDLLRRIVSDAVDKAVADLQKRIDEEGCGAAMAAMKGWS